MFCPSAERAFDIRTLLVGLVLCCLLLVPGCAAKQEKDELFSVAQEQSASHDPLDDYDSTPTQSISDPIEPWNRFWFRFNDGFYVHVARPVYNAYDYVMPDAFQSGLKNFFHNLLFPVRFVNNILQGKFSAAVVEAGKFIVNTTVGFGFFDITKDRAIYAQGYDPHGADFGQTLGVWGMGQGMYIVWPLLGPSSVRETVGMIGNMPLNPTFYVQPWHFAAEANVGMRFTSLDTVLPLYEDIKGASVDPYIAMREAFVEYRKRRVSGGTALPAAPRPVEYPQE